ncbi:MAG: hypothetical protein ACOVMH_02100 [Flavobacterium sp.]
MNKIFIFCIVILNQLLNSQTLDIKTTKSVVFNDGFNNTSVLFSDKTEEGNLVIVRSSKSNSMFYSNGLFIEEFDRNLKFKYSLDIEFKNPLHRKYTNLVSIFYHNNMIVFINLFYDLKQKAYVFGANKLSIKTKKLEFQELIVIKSNEFLEGEKLNIESLFNENLKKIFIPTNGIFISSAKTSSTQGEIINSSYLPHNERNSGFLFTKNNQRFLIGIDFSNEKNRKLKLFSFSLDGTLLKTDYIDEPTKVDQIGNFKFIDLLANNSIIVVDKIHFKNESLFGKYKPSNYEVIKIENGTKQKIIIDSKDQYVENTNFKTTNNKLFLVGFSSKEKDYSYSGVYINEINLDPFELITSKNFEFSEQLIIDKFGKSKNKELKNLKLREIHLNNDNEIYINGEEEILKNNYNSGTSIVPNKTVSLSSNFNNVSMATNYQMINSYSNYEDLLCIKINDKRELIWSRIINKKQSEENSFNSYTSFLKNEDIFFIFNAKDKIKELKNNRIEFVSNGNNSNSNLMILKIDKNGNYNYQEILDKDENATPFMVSNGIKIDDSYYFYGVKNKKKQLLKIEMN